MYIISLGLRLLLPKFVAIISIFSKLLFSHMLVIQYKMQFKFKDECKFSSTKIIQMLVSIKSSSLRLLLSISVSTTKISKDQLSTGGGVSSQIQINAGTIPTKPIQKGSSRQDQGVQC